MFPFGSSPVAASEIEKTFDDIRFCKSHAWDWEAASALLAVVGRIVDYMNAAEIGTRHGDAISRDHDIELADQLFALFAKSPNGEVRIRAGLAAVRVASILSRIRHLDMAEKKLHRGPARDSGGKRNA